MRDSRQISLSAALPTAIVALLLFSLTSINSMGIKQAFAQSATVDNTVTMRTLDQNGNEVLGLFVAVEDSSFHVINSGFSPITTTGLASGLYYVAVYDNFVGPDLTYTFQSAQSDPSGFVPTPFTITEWGGFGSVQIPDDGTTHSITVNGSYLVTPSHDVAPPVVTLTPARAPDSNGYYNHAVTFTAAGNDGTTGNSNPVTCDAPITYAGPDGGSITVSASCQDGAGNIGHGSATIAYDATAPAMTAAIAGSITNGAIYIVGSVPANNMSCSATDAVSGLDGACTVTGYSTVVGSHTLTATAKDKAGNIATKQDVSYNVVYKFINVFPTKTGFQVKQGTPAPFGFLLLDSTNKSIGTANARIFVDNNPGKCLVVAGIGSNTNAFTFVNALKAYGCALDTKNLSVGTHTAEVRLDDGTTQSYSIKILNK